MGQLLGKLLFLMPKPVTLNVPLLYCNSSSNRFYVGKKPQILISDLDILKQIMVKEFDNFSDHSVS